MTGTESSGDEMKTIMIDGYKFEGPYQLDKDDVPSKPGIMLISTEAGEGFKIMCIEESSDMCEHIRHSDRKDVWRNAAYHSEVDVYVHETDCSDERRASMTDSLVARRASSLNCQVQKVIEDDW